MSHMQEESYRIHLPQFEGPFDLLLFFIERDELDIHDIPIAQITRDFLDYVHTMQEMNIELASEFILVAGTLMRIKARLLLPRPVLNEQGEEVDPREELVQRLLEYKRYKAVLAELAELEQAQAEREVRGNIKAEEKLLLSTQYPEDELMGTDLYALMRTFKRVWEKHHDRLQKPRHVIKKYPYNPDEVKEKLISRVAERGRQDFVSLVMEEQERIYVVFCFLAILELIQLQRISVVIGEGYNNFWIAYREPEPESEPATLPMQEPDIPAQPDGEE
ncbi:MAG: segregation/condensation protein A [Bacteroidia bacterium]|jgi:segregation and condensation protein A|nr:segregation/condensation protein A [Bacteroidia bacterium]